jgi:hypothetical protein
MGKSKPRRRLPRSRRRTLIIWILIEAGALALLGAASWAGLPIPGGELWNRLHKAWLILRAVL